MFVFQAERNILMQPFHRLGVAGVPVCLVAILSNARFFSNLFFYWFELGLLLGRGT